MTAIALALFLCLAADEAGPPGGLAGGAYIGFELHHCDVLTGNLKTTVREMTGAVDMTLIAQDPERNLRVQAETVRFAYDSDTDRVPSQILLEKNVVVAHPQGTVHSQMASIDFTNSVVRFTGRPRLDSAQLQGLEATEIVLNLETEDFTILNPRAERVLFETKPEEHPWDSLLLTQENINGWPELLTRLKAESAQAEDNPSKQIVQLLDDAAREAFRAAPVETLVLNTGAILAQINAMLTAPAFYNRNAWKNIKIGEDAGRLAASGPENIDKTELVWLNRMILHSAFRTHFQAPPPLETLAGN